MKDRFQKFRSILHRSAVIFVLSGILLFPAGCQNQEDSEKTEVEYTVAAAEEIPDELAAVIEENRESEMWLTWMDGDEMYLIRGYGKQATGGYSIAVAECTEDEETLWFDTRLIGPQKEDTASAEPSYPWLAVKITATDKEVVIE
ncbi:MAG: protease complex subunit PrcB family protein [Lachnospiraceae bacterium]|nr:protease complex subunit PrcB family protein [Lachnospiraceae bacterium]